MNDNNDNVIDLMTTATALIVPDGLHDVLILGFKADGSLYFNSEADLASIALLLTLAQRRVVEEHGGGGYDDLTDPAA